MGRRTSQETKVSQRIICLHVMEVGGSQTNAIEFASAVPDKGQV
jgi:hypothetical protein